MWNSARVKSSIRVIFRIILNTPDLVNQSGIGVKMLALILGEVGQWDTALVGVSVEENGIPSCFVDVYWSGVSIRTKGIFKGTSFMIFVTDIIKQRQMKLLVHLAVCSVSE